ncbi:MAG: efflux RND transporter permease subunit [Roseburia sp.]|nr:efflux RND transporter permease subunit [Roseburia sp.]
MIPKYSVKRPYTVLVAVVLVIVLGVVSLTRMTTDLLPAMNLPYVIVVTTDVGASPEKVEKDVTSPIEAAMATTSNINNVSSMSYDNYSMVVLEYEQSTNMDSAMIEIQQQLDQLTGQFPDSVGTPIIMQIDPDMMPVMIASADVDGMDQAEVSDYVDNELLPLLESIEGVASVTATGVLDTDLQVTMDQEKIDALNEQILSKIDAQFTDAQAELDKASSKINSGKKKLSDGEKEMGSQLGAGENEIINNKIQLFNTEADLTTQLSDLQKSQSSMDGAIKSLQSAYDGATQLQSAIDGLQKAKDGVSQAKSGAKQLYAMKPQLQQLAASVPAWGGTLPTDYNTFITTLESTVNYMKTLTDPVKQAQAAQMEQMLTGLKSSMTPEIYKALVASASESDFIAYMESTAIAQINAQAGTSYTSESDIASQIVTLQSKLDDINVMLMSQASSFADAGVTLTSYKDIPAAISKLSESKTQIAAGIATIESAQTQVADGKTSLDDALVTLNESQISGIMEMSKGYADLAVAANKIEEGQSQLDDAKEQAKDSADLNTILTMDTLKNLLTAQNFSMPAGYVTEGNEQYLVRVGDEVTSKADLENLVLMDLGMDGIEPVRLSDVADIEYIDNSGDSYSKVNGNPAVMLSIEKQTGYSTGDVTDRLLDKFDSLEKENTALHLSVLMNQGIYIDMIVKSVVENMIVGAILAIIVLLLFLKDMKPTLVIACSIPLSVVFAVVLMYFTNITLNIISLSGLALGIGMLVDNSIVVIENIYRLRGEGYSIRKAAVEGASQVTGAIIASTLTTICVFAPIIFTEGITRQLFVDIALTIAFTLAASLLVALTFVPMMAAGLLKNTKEIRHNFFDKVKEVYGKILAVCLRFKPIVFIAVIVLLGTSVVAAFSRGYSFMDMNMETNQISATISAKEDETLTFDELTEMADEVVEKALTIDGIETIGAMAGGSALSMMGGSSTDSISMYMILDEESEVSSADVIEQLDELTKDMDCEVTTDTSASDMTSLMGSGLTINVKGNNLDKLQELAGEVAKVVENTEGTVDVDDGLANTTPSFTISVDKEKAAKYGMTVAQVFQLVYGEMTSSTSATTISTDVNEYQVYVQSEEQSDVTLADIKNLTFTYTDREGNETETALSDIAQFEEGYTLGTINRDAQTRYISVTAGVDDDHNVSLLSNEIQKELDKIDLPEGYSIEMAGEDEMIADAMNQLYLMLLLAVIFIYLVMVAQFQSLLSPFIIMFTIPLAFTGGLFALYFTGNEVSVVAMIGFVMLAGIIVNNGIVMVDFINQLRRGGMEKKDAIIESGKTRLRPILMTALTTILSMSTMAVGLGEGSEMMQPMAIVTVGGLLYGTLLTLIVVPCIYDAFNRNKSMVEEDL